jgi:hypothetical protein
MGADLEVKVLLGPERKEPITEVTRAASREVVWWKSKVQCRTERKRSADQACCPRGEPANGGEAQFPLGGARIGDGVGMKICVLTRGDLSASAADLRER